MDLNKKLKELKPQQLNCNVFDVYSYNGLTMQDLLCQFFTTINECVKSTNDVIDLTDWLVNIGLEEEVVKKLMGLIKDGTVEKLINVNLFENLNRQLEHKANKGDYITVSQIDKNKGLLDETYFTDEFKSQFVENTQPLHTVPADYSITTKKLVFPVLIGQQSKNLFDKNDVVAGKYVSYINGNLFDNASYNASGFIKIEPSTNYCVKFTQQLAFYDVNKTFISGLNLTSTTSFVTPSNACFIRLSVVTSNLSLEQLEKGTKSTEYEDFQATLDVDTIKDKSIAKNKLNFIPAECNIGKNLFDKNDVVAGKYVSYINGQLFDASGYNASNFIKIKPTTTYCVKYWQQLAFYNEDKVFISGINITNGTAKFTTPDNAYYVRLTITDSNLSTEQLEEGTNTTSYESYGYYLNIKQITGLESLLNKTNKIYVGEGKQFTNLRLALESITDSSFNNKYEVYLDKGTYDIKSYYTNKELSSTFIGLFVPDYVTIIGCGSPNDVILKATMEEKHQNFSTLNLKATSGLKNLTVIGEKTRYAVHDDFAHLSSYDKNYNRNVENCIFIARQCYYGVAYGSGTRSGAIWNFNNCVFDSDINIPFGWHSNVNFNLPNDITFENCEFISNGDTALKIGCMKSNVINNIKLIGCDLNNKKVVIRGEQDNSIASDIKLKGYANTDFNIEVLCVSENYVNKNGFIKVVK